MNVAYYLRRIGRNHDVFLLLVVNISPADFEFSYVRYLRALDVL